MRTLREIESDVEIDSDMGAGDTSETLDPGSLEPDN
jgi:hypothetical protein